LLARSLRVTVRSCYYSVILIAGGVLLQCDIANLPNELLMPSCRWFLM
jgi:hypothetical protein